MTILKYTVLKCHIRSRRRGLLSVKDVMWMDVERITLRMEPEDVFEMDVFLDENPEFANRSQLIRIALRNYMRRDAQEEETGGLKIQLGDRYIRALAALKENGFADTEAGVVERIVERTLVPRETLEDAAKKAFAAYDMYPGLIEK